MSGQLVIFIVGSIYIIAIGVLACNEIWKREFPKVWAAHERKERSRKAKA